MWDGPTCVAFGHISCKVCTYNLQIPTLSFVFFSKKKKIPRMQEVVYKVIRCTYLGAVHKICRLGRGEGGSPKDDLLIDPT